MNFSRSTTLRVLFVTLLLPLCARAGDAKTELEALVKRISAKIELGQRTEAELAPDIAQFDALLAAHKGETTDDVARIAVMKATLYIQVIENDDKGLVFLKQATTDFPQYAQLKGLAAMIAAIEAEQAFAVGKILPDFAEKDLNGKPLSIASHKGKVVLIDFWATWCGPCLAELPNVVAAYKKYHDRGFEIIGISLDREDAREKLVEFTKNREMPWAQFYDGQYWNNKLSTQYGVTSIPTTFLLDGEGRVIAKNLRGEALAAELEKRLAAK